MSTLRRQRSQRQAALSLERAYPDLLTELAPLLGRFFAEAGESEKAVQYLVKAGDTALSLFAYDDASDAYEKALLFLREMRANHKAARTLMKLGLTYHNTFRFDQAHAAYEEAFTWWQRAPVLPDENLAPARGPFRTHLRPLYTIDPTRSAHFSSAIVIQQLFSGLLQIDSEHELIPDVARRWDVLDGGRRYIFYLRDDVVWSDGRPVLADDFAYAWRRVLEPTSGSYPAELLYDIQGAREYHQGNLDDASALGVRAVDERTLIIELEGPASYFLQLLTHSVGMPVPRHVVQAHGDRWVELGNLVTNGSFQLVSEDDERLILERNSTYHGRFTGNLDRVEARLIRSATEAWNEYRTDQLDCLQLMPLFSPEGHDRARRLHPDEYIGGRIPSVTFLALDVTRPPFDDILVRRALALAIDRDSLAAKWLMGQYPPAKGGFIPPGLPGHKGGIGIPFDPDEARRLLDKAGYSHAESMPPIDAQAFRGDVYQAIVNGLKEQWQSHLGMKISFRPFVAEARANIWLAGVSPEYPDADSFLRVNNWSGVNGWRREKFEHLVEGARRVTDWEKRMSMYQQADRILVEDAAILPLVYGRAHVLLKPWVTKYPLSPLSIPYWKDMVMDENQ
jgi:oligopeptide transport system substrate-binding protein